MTFTVASNLAVDYCLNGRYQHALKLDDQIYWDRLGYYGQDDHRWVLASLGAVARDLCRTGDYAAAVEMGGRTRQGFTKLGTLPEGHLLVLQQAKEHSIALRKAGDRRGALELAREVFEKYRQMHGVNYPDTLSAEVCLGNAERLVSEVGETSGRLEDAARRYGKIWGTDHPFTYGCALNLAIARRLVGNLKGARVLLEQAFSGLRRTVGEDHHYTIMCLANLSTIMAELRDIETARELGETALRQFIALLGDDHPHVLACAANFALDLRSPGRIDEADALATDAHERLARTLGKDHPDVLQAIRGERLMFDFDPPSV